MAFLGANTEQLREHAQRLSERAGNLTELRDQLGTVVMNDGIWQGPDADTFRDRWASDIANRFQEAAERLRQEGTDLEQQAQEQDQTSQDEGGGGATGGASMGGDGSGESKNPISELLKALSKGQSLYSKLSKMVDFMSRIGSAADEFARLAERGMQGLWKASYLDELFGEGKNWQKIGEKVAGKLGLPSSIGKLDGLKFLNKIDDVSPFLKSGGKVLGKALPFLDVGFGLHQMITAPDAYSKVSGGMGALGGSLLIAAPFTGPAAPVVGAIGAGLGAASVAMDLGKMAYDNIPVVHDAVNAVGSMAVNAGHAVGDAASAVADGIGDVGSAISDGLGKVGDAFGF